MTPALTRRKAQFAQSRIVFRRLGLGLALSLALALPGAHVKMPQIPASSTTPLDQLAGEIAALEARIAEAQAKGELPAELPEIEAADRRVAETEDTARAFESTTPLDQLAGETAALEAWAAAAQAKGALPADLTEIETADRRAAEAEGRARVIECIGDILTRRTP